MCGSIPETSGYFSECFAHFCASGMLLTLLPDIECQDKYPVRISTVCCLKTVLPVGIYPGPLALGICPYPNKDSHQKFFLPHCQIRY